MKTAPTGEVIAVEDLVRLAVMAVLAVPVARADLARREIARPANAVGLAVPVVPDPKVAVADPAARAVISIAVKDANAAKRRRHCRR